MTSQVVAEKKKIKLSYMLNIILLLLIVIGCIFGYLYYKSLNPADELVNKIVPVGKVPKATFLYSIYGNDKYRLNNPQRVVVINNRTYVSTGNDGKIAIFDKDGKFIKYFTNQRRGPFYPYGMTVVNNQLYVADAGSRLIRIFDLDGNYVKDFAPKKVLLPTDVAFYDNKFYVIDSGPQCVRVFDAQGNQTLLFGKESNKNKPKEKKPSEFYFPNGIGVSGDKIYVADSDNSRIQIFDLKGKFLKEINKDKNGDNILNIPRSIALDKNGNIFTANNMGHEIVIFNDKAEEVTSFSNGEKDGDSLNLPNGIFIDDANKAYVPEFAGNRVLVYQLR